MNVLQEVGLLALNVAGTFLFLHLWEVDREIHKYLKRGFCLGAGAVVCAFGALAIAFDLGVYLYKVLTR